MASHSVKDVMNDMEAAKQNPHATVEEYTRTDGTIVHEHWRSKPDGSSNGDVLQGIIEKDDTKTNDDDIIILPDGTRTYPLNPNDTPPLPDDEKETTEQVGCNFLHQKLSQIYIVDFIFILKITPIVFIKSSLNKFIK